MATVQKRGDSYRIRVSAGYDTSGKQIVRSMTWTPSPGMTEKQIAKELERQKVLFEESIALGQYSGKNVKFKMLAEEWLKQAEFEGNLKPLSLKRLKSCQDRTYAAIGHLYVGRITTRHIQSFINNLAEDGINQRTGGGLSTKTQKHYLNFISDVFRYAIKCDIVQKNPCENVSTIKFEQKERKVYTLEEAQAFISALDRAPIKYRMFFLLAIYGGFRRGELLGFEWKDIDFDSGIISVNRTSLYDKEQGGMFTCTPKTKGSVRSLKLPNEIIHELNVFKKWQIEERLKIGDQWQDHDRLFTQWDGSPGSGDTYRHWLEKFCKKEGLPYVNVHSFRHLNASLLISSGVDIRTVSASLGHSQTSTTLNIYAHAFAETQAKASEAVANSLGLHNQKKQA